MKPDKVTFCAAGDVMLDRRVKTFMAEKGSIYPFREITTFIKRHDLSFCNLEGPVSVRGNKVPKAYSFRFDPAILDGLKYTGFNMYSLANNHMLDYGSEALLDTVNYVKGQGYFYAGAGINREEASAAKYKKIKGLTFAFIANVDFPMDGWANEVDGSLPLPFDRAKPGELTAAVAEAKTKADFVIVSFHWGDEYKNYPNNRQKKIARACVDSGADLILGHHPHVMQGVEKYKNKYILYSLGNFVFDQRFPSTKEAMVFCCDFTREGIQNAFLMPVRIKKGKPAFASGRDAGNIMKKITEYSRDFNVAMTPDNAKIRID
jgi:poly-gamma-glutamate synthesis protein (capsule biosynthesis protein)